MDTHLTLTTLLSLATVMLIGASVPSVSVFAVSARAATFGFYHGALTALGIVLGDIIFIVIAIYGLTMLVDLLGEHFNLIKYLGGAYLIWIGISLWRNKSATAVSASGTQASVQSSFLTGLLITLADQKAILFYLGFFPAFIDLTRLTLLDSGLILGIALVAVGVPKLLYAYLADRAGRVAGNSFILRILKPIAGSVMIGIGIYLFIRN